MKAGGMLSLALLLSAPIIAAEAQRAEARGYSRAPTAVFRANAQDSTRAVLGVSTSSTGARDTLGLLITAVTPGGPAEKAGIVEGNRIVAVNGQELRLSSADAGEPDMRGLMTRRLTRELGKMKPGDTVELRIWSGGQQRNVRVQTAAASEVMPRLSREQVAAQREERAVIGASVGGSGSVRDTLGLLVTRVVADGPAEKAGIYEGHRIATINGVDLRVSAVDAEDSYVAGLMANRFSRELRKLKPGDSAELRVWADGRYRSVRVTTARQADVYAGRGGEFFFFPGRLEVMPAPAPRAPMPPMPPMPGARELRIDLEPLERALQEVRISGDLIGDDLRNQMDALRHEFGPLKGELESALDAARDAIRHQEEALRGLWEGEVVRRQGQTSL